MRIAGWATVVLCAGLFVSNVPAQDQRPEFLVVQNRQERPVRVSLRAHNGAFRDWQNFEAIEGGKAGSIQLKGYQPFDITVRLEDGTAYVFSKIYLCNYMRICRETGQKGPWKLKGRIWKKINGRDVDQRSFATFSITCESNLVDLEFSPLIGRDLPGPPPPPPDKKPKPKNPQN